MFKKNMSIALLFGLMTSFIIPSHIFAFSYTELDVEVDIEKPLPDLHFENIIHNGGNLSFDVVNSGNAGTEESLVRILWVDKDGEYVVEDGAPVISLNYPKILSGESISKSYSIANPKKTASEGIFGGILGSPTTPEDVSNFLKNVPDGAVKLRFIIDHMEEIQESNEDNNTYEIDKPLGDLLFGDVVYTSKVFSYEILNGGGSIIGGGMGTPGPSFSLIWLNKEGSVVTHPDVPLMVPSYWGLLPGNSISELYSLSNPIDPVEKGIAEFFEKIPFGATKLQLALDYKSQIKELNESNNILQMDRLLPDLSIESIVFTYDSLSFFVINKGTLEAPPSVVNINWVDIDGEPLDSGKTTLKSSSPFSVGGGTYHFYNIDQTPNIGEYVLNAPQGAKKLRLYVEPNNTIEELDKENNIAYATILLSKMKGGDIADLDGDIEPSEIDQEEPKILPGNIFYQAKRLGRSLSILFTVNDEKEANLQLSIADKKILEIQKLKELGEEEKAVKHLISYNKEFAKITTRASRLKNKSQEKAERFAEKVFEHGAKHQIILSSLKGDISSDYIENVKESQDKLAHQMVNSLASIEEKIKQEKLIKRSFNDDGSPFMPLRNIEVLMLLKDFARNNEVREALENAEKNSLKRFAEQHYEMPEEYKDMVAEYVSTSNGDRLDYLLIIESEQYGEIVQKRRVEIENRILQMDDTETHTKNDGDEINRSERDELEEESSTNTRSTTDTSETRSTTDTSETRSTTDTSETRSTTDTSETRSTTDTSETRSTTDTSETGSTTDTRDIDDTTEIQTPTRTPEPEETPTRR